MKKESKPPYTLSEAIARGYIRTDDLRGSTTRGYVVSDLNVEDAQKGGFTTTPPPPCPPPDFGGEPSVGDRIFMRVWGVCNIISIIALILFVIFFLVAT